MAGTLKLVDRGPITFDSARETDENIINQSTYFAATTELYNQLWAERETISAVVKHHLGLGHLQDCIVQPPLEWIRGSFNVCIPVSVTSGAVRKRYIPRCPMAHKLAEARYPGTVDEKLGCEVGTYAWVQDHCPEIRIPFLYGFGFSDHRHFTHEARRPWYIRLARRLRRGIRAILQRPGLSHYVSNQTRHQLPTAYILIEYIEPDVGQMLSATWEQHRQDPDRRATVLRGMARIILSLARIPQPRIGSFQFHNDCTVTLTNRPLTCSTMILENDGTPRVMSPNDTYSCTEPFVADMLNMHDNRLLSNPNAIDDEQECRSQMATRTLLRCLVHHFISRERRNGPFLLQFTDLHASNLFVDQDWNITCLVDLEWVCALPSEMISVPYWLSGVGIEEITEEHLENYKGIVQEFIRIVRDTGSETHGHCSMLAGIMRDMWDSQGIWFWYCLESVNAMYFLAADHICPRFSTALSENTEQILSGLWCEDSDKVVAKKVEDQSRYVRELRGLFN